VPAGRGRDQSLGQVGRRAQGRGAHEPLDLAQRLQRRARLIELAARDPGADQHLQRGCPVQATVRRQLTKHPLYQLDRAECLPSIERQPRVAQLRSR